MPICHTSLIILEEEAPDSIPIPDALLPRIIEFIKQFPHFLETIGSCARKYYYCVSYKGPGSLPANLSSPSSSSGVVPDLDQSVVSVARDYLSSGSTSNVVSVSGDYCDPSGKVIKRPHFALDMDTREEFFIELILSRHARKLLTTNCLYDLGLFAAHLDFDLQQWMAKERHRAACIDNYIQVLCELHKQFHWPLPPSSTSTTPSSVREQVVMTTNELSADKKLPENENVDNLESSLDITKRGLKRLNCPPDLNISGTHSQIETVEATVGGEEEESTGEHQIEEEVIVHSSTPSKLSGTGSYSYSSENFIKPPSSDRLYGSDSLVEIIDDSSLWEEDITMTTGWIIPSKTVQSELEIRYFINASVNSYCLEWVVILGVLLQDLSIFMHVQQQLNYLDSQTTFPDDIDTRLLNGINSLSEWVAINCPGYLPFLSLITPILYQWQQLLQDHVRNVQDTPLLNDSTHQLLSAQVVEGTDSVSKDDKPVNLVKQAKQDLYQQSNEETSGCIIT